MSNEKNNSHGYMTVGEVAKKNGRHSSDFAIL